MTGMRSGPALSRPRLGGLCRNRAHLYTSPGAPLLSGGRARPARGEMPTRQARPLLPGWSRGDCYPGRPSRGRPGSCR